MIVGTFRIMFNKSLMDKIKYLVKLKYDVELKSNFNILMYYYIFCLFLWPIVLIKSIRILIKGNN